MPLIPRVTSGEPLALSAGAWNELRAGVESLGTRGMSRASAAGGTRYRIENTSAETFPFGGCAAIDRTQQFLAVDDDSDIPGWKSQPGFVGIVPTRQTTQWGVPLQAVAPDTVGAIALTGYVHALVEIRDPHHSHCTPRTGVVDYLVSASYGAARIIDIAPQTRRTPDEALSYWVTRITGEGASREGLSVVAIVSPLVS